MSLALSQSTEAWPLSVDGTIANGDSISQRAYSVNQASKTIYGINKLLTRSFVSNHEDKTDSALEPVDTDIDLPLAVNRIYPQEFLILRSKPISTGATATVQMLAEWHGQVLEIFDNAFVAELRGKHGDGVAGKQEEALIPLEEIQEADKELLEEGAFFRLCISYWHSSTGTRRRFTEIVFRRMPAYRREELEAAEHRGREIARGLRLE